MPSAVATKNLESLEIQRQREQEERVLALKAAIDFEKAPEEEKAVEIEDIRRKSKVSETSDEFGTI